MIVMAGLAPAIQWITGSSPVMTGGGGAIQMLPKAGRRDIRWKQRGLNFSLSTKGNPATAGLAPAIQVDHRVEPGDDEGRRRDTNVTKSRVPRHLPETARTQLLAVGQRQSRHRPDRRGVPPMLKTLTLAIAVAAVTAAAAPAHAQFPISGNGLSANGLSSNAMTQNGIEAHAALNGRVIGIELPSQPEQPR
jgi:hypothetical protein